ncbi:MAG: FAD-binding protein [Chloroflexi bacterium]|nr:FAD-binding protein [Chloroflexota bacterium]
MLVLSVPSLAPPDSSRAGDPGLYVADASTFPTGIGVHPMIAVMAMAKRVSRTIAAEGRWRS